MSLETLTQPEAAESPAVRSTKPRTRRKILCAFPRYSYSFGTFNHAFPLMGDVKGFMPPQGILVITALIPDEGEIKFVDENMARVTREEFAWADVVFVSGMHIQRHRIHDITRRAHDAGKAVALGGPSVSSAPDYYPDVDLLHCGETGDATLRLLHRIDETVERPEQQIIYPTVDRLPLSEFPPPADGRAHAHRGEDAAGVFHQLVVWHRNAGPEGAQGEEERAEHAHAESRGGANGQSLWHRGGVGQHHGPRYGHRRNAPGADGFRGR